MGAKVGVLVRNLRTTRVNVSESFGVSSPLQSGITQLSSYYSECVYDSFSRNVKQMMSSAKRCSVLSLVPVTDAGPDLSITEFKLTRTTDDPGR